MDVSNSVKNAGGDLTHPSAARPPNRYGRMFEALDPWVPAGEDDANKRAAIDQRASALLPDDTAWTEADFNPTTEKIDEEIKELFALVAQRGEPALLGFLFEQIPIRLVFFGDRINDDLRVARIQRFH